MKADLRCGGVLWKGEAGIETHAFGYDFGQIGQNKMARGITAKTDTIDEVQRAL